MPMKPTGYRFHIDHIIPRRLGGSDDLSNLALACQPCNAAKHMKVSAKDPRTGKGCRLFNPRVHQWSEHFRWSQDRTKIYGRTAIGRATVAALRMNDEYMQAARRCLLFLDLTP
jgi:hypothetical protein